MQSLNLTKKLPVVSTEEEIACALLDLQPIAVTGCDKITIRLLQEQFSVEHALWFDEVLKHSECIKEVHFSHINCEDEATIQLSKTLQENKNITSIDLEDAFLGPHYYLTFTKLSPFVKNLAVDRCYIKEEAIQILADVIRANTTLTELSLTFCNLDSYELLCESFVANSTITDLNLTGNSFGAKSLDYLVSNSKTIKKLNFGANHIKITGELTRALKMNTALTELSLQNALKSGSHLLFDGLRGNTSVKILNISNNELNNQDIISLNELLIVNSTIEKLVMKEVLSQEPMKIFHGLKKNRGLTYLNMTKNNLRAEQFKELADALEENSKLLDLFLTSISIEASSTKLLAEALKINSTLETLDLGIATISQEITPNFCDMIRFHKSLTELNMSHTIMDNACLEQIREALQYNSYLTKVTWPRKVYQKLADVTAASGILKSNTVNRDGIRMKIIIIVYNIARSASFDVFPLELWMHIFKYFKFPGIRTQFDQVLYQLCSDSSIRRVV